MRVLFASQGRSCSARGGKLASGLFLVVKRHSLHNNKRLNMEFFAMFVSLNQQLDLHRVSPKTNVFYYTQIAQLRKRRRQLFAVQCCCNFFQIPSIKQLKSFEQSLLINCGLVTFTKTNSTGNGKSFY